MYQTNTPTALDITVINLFGHVSARECRT